MKSKDLFRLIKQASGIVETVIVNRTPSITSALIKAARYLNVAKAASVEVNQTEVLPESFTLPVRQIVAELSQVMGDVCSNRDDVSKSIKPSEFATHVREEIEKCLAEGDNVKALASAYSLRRRIGKALETFEKFGQLPEEMETFFFDREDAVEASALKKAIDDAAAPAKTPEEAVALRKAATPAPGAWTTGEVDVTKAAVDPAVELATARAAVEKAATVIKGRGRDGWAGFGGDINSAEFLTGVAPEIDFGPDPV